MATDTRVRCPRCGFHGGYHSENCPPELDYAQMGHNVTGPSRDDIEADFAAEREDPSWDYASN